MKRNKTPVHELLLLCNGEKEFHHDEGNQHLKFTVVMCLHDNGGALVLPGMYPDIALVTICDSCCPGEDNLYDVQYV